MKLSSRGLCTLLPNFEIYFSSTLLGSTLPFTIRLVSDCKSLLKHFFSLCSCYRFSCLFTIKPCSFCFSWLLARFLSWVFSMICIFLFVSIRFYLVFNKIRSSSLSLCISCLSISSWLRSSTNFYTFILLLSSLCSNC